MNAIEKMIKEKKERTKKLHRNLTTYLHEVILSNVDSEIIADEIIVLVLDSLFEIYDVDKNKVNTSHWENELLDSISEIIDKIKTSRK